MSKKTTKNNSQKLKWARKKISTMWSHKKQTYSILSLEQVLAASIQFESEDVGALAVVSSYLTAGTLKVHGRLMVDASVRVLITQTMGVT